MISPTPAYFRELDRCQCLIEQQRRALALVRRTLDLTGTGAVVMAWPDEPESTIGEYIDEILKAM